MAAVNNTSRGNSGNRRGKLRLTLWRWHRRVGLVAALFVVLLAVTGILLNHTDTLKLDQARLSPPWLTFLYGVELPVAVSFAAGGNIVTQWGEGEIYRNGSYLLSCEGELVGAVAHREFDVLACQREVVLLLSDTGQVVERIGAVHGLPAPLRQLGRCGSDLCARAGQGVYQLDPDALSWTPTGESPTWSRPVPTPAPVQENLAGNHTGQSLNWERLLLDLHSGRIAGPWGVLVMDLMAVLFLILAVSGVLIWLIGQRRRKADGTRRSG